MRWLAFIGLLMLALLPNALMAQEKEGIASAPS